MTKLLLATTLALGACATAPTVPPGATLTSRPGSSAGPAAPGGAHFVLCDPPGRPSPCQINAPYMSPIPRNAVEACIVWRESRGEWNPEPPGDGGQRYQIEPATWREFGGVDWGHASPYEQDAVFVRIVAADGYQPWAADGCAA